MSKKKVTILSIDGGGIRGVLPGTVLARLEAILQEKTNNPDARLYDFFDLMAGTSTGGILTACYLTPGENGRPKYSAQEALDLYLQNGEAIFARTRGWKWKSLFGIREPKYRVNTMEALLQRYFGDTWLSDLLRPCIMTSFWSNSEEQKNRSVAFFFRQHRARNQKTKEVNEDYDYKVWQVTRSTSAAPTYFKPALVGSRSESSDSLYALLDGGVFANNPAHVAYTDASTMDFPHKEIENPQAKDMLVVSLNTGGTIPSYSYEKTSRWGLVGWVQPVIDIMMAGNVETVHYQLKQLFDKAKCKDCYHRLETKVHEANSAMDDASAENMPLLKADGERNARDLEDQLQVVAQQLIDSQG